MSKVILLADRRTERPAPLAPPPAGRPPLDRRARGRGGQRLTVNDRRKLTCTKNKTRRGVSFNKKII
ncbi:hypothetical protein NAT65_05245, partial [Achromobacter xylosoxidans]|nr:hypothetical protein [Achromobacter xylosoxidans]